MANKIQHKRGLKANLPTLNVAEMGFATDTKELFVGSASGNVQLAKQEDLTTQGNAKEPLLSTAATKTTPVDADAIVLTDSAASNKTKRTLWSNVKTTLKAYFDTLYNNYTHPTGDGNLHVPVTGTANSGKVLKAGSTAGSLSWGTLAKADVGLGSVDNVQQATKAEFNAHLADYAAHNIKTNTARTVYINYSSGADENNGLTVGTAFKTFNRALDSLPLQSGAESKIILIGNYPSAINISCKHVYNLIIEGSTTNPSTQIISGAISIVSSSRVTVRYVTCEKLLAYSSIIEINACAFTVSASDGVYANFSVMKVVNCNFGSAADKCINADAGSTVYSESNSGSGNYGLAAYAGSTIGKGGTQPTGTTANELTTGGGVIR